MVLSTTSGIGSLTRTVRFPDGIWQRYDLTHSLGDPRSLAIFGEHTLRMGREPTRAEAPPIQPTPIQGLLPTPPPQSQPDLTCTQPTRPPLTLTPPAHASNAINLLMQPNLLSDDYLGCRTHINIERNRRTQTQDRDVQGLPRCAAPNYIAS